MRTRLLIGASVIVLGVGAGFAAPRALADVTVFATITKDETITVTENITKTKDVDIFVRSTQTPTGAAEANAVANVLNNNVHVDKAVSDAVIGTVTTTTEFGIFRSATIDGSVNTNSGIVGVNQDVGNFANQSNIVSIALSTSTSSVTNAEASVSQANTNSSATELEEFFSLLPGINALNNQNASITGSVNGNTGVVGVNQNAGNMNNQTNALALAVGPGSTTALAEADLGQENFNDVVHDVNTHRADLISGSVQGNTGITTVNQSVGNFNNQSTTISFAALTASAAVGSATSAALQPRP